MNNKQIEQVVDALIAAQTAIDDWTNLAAPDWCDEDRVQEAKARVYQDGMLWYVANVQNKIRKAIALLVEQQSTVSCIKPDCDDESNKTSNYCNSHRPRLSKDEDTQVGPHEFSPLGKWLPWRRNWCRACYHHKDHHPIQGWVEARPLMDYSTRPYLPYVEEK